METISREELVSILREHLGEALLYGDAIPSHYHSDWTGHAPCQPLALYRPTTTEEVARCLALCNQYRVPVVPQGGLTGLAAGAEPTADVVAVSLDRLTGPIEINEASGTLTSWAGNTLEAVQQKAEQHGWRYPVDFGARGSCQIGGNIATNAGGHAVIRHGMTRQQVLGLEVVLADGRILNLLSPMIKNNTGYDLKHYFIGSEGTLGIITRAVLRLSPLLGQTQTVLCALPDYESALNLLAIMRRPGMEIEAFEVMWNCFYAMSCDWLQKTPPIEAHHSLYVLCEVEGNAALVEEALAEAMEAGAVVDAVFASSEQQAQQLWEIREATAEFPVKMSPINFDISLPLPEIGRFVESATAAILSEWPAARVVNFGHIGDGNLHLTIDARSLPDQNKETVLAAEEIIYRLVANYHGAISAEHGIGVLKKAFLHHSVDELALSAMQSIKQSLDPKGILNPGKIFDMPRDVSDFSSNDDLNHDN